MFSKKKHYLLKRQICNGAGDIAGRSQEDMLQFASVWHLLSDGDMKMSSWTQNFGISQFRKKFLLIFIKIRQK